MGFSNSWILTSILQLVVQVQDLDIQIQDLDVQIQDLDVQIQDLDVQTLKSMFYVPILQSWFTWLRILFTIAASRLRELRGLVKLGNIQKHRGGSPRKVQTE